MALIMMDGFDVYNGYGSNVGVSSYWTVNTTAGQSLIGGRFGGQAIFNNSGNQARYMQRSLDAPVSAFCAGIAMYSNEGSTVVDTGHVFVLFDDATVKIVAGIDPTAGKILVGTTDYTTNLLAESASGLWAFHLWHYIEVRVVIDAVNGSVEAWLNGTKVIDETGLNTGTGTGNLFRIDTRSFHQGSSQSQRRHDDFYLTDNERIGVRRIVQLVPAADTAQKDCTPSTGTDNYAMVDEATTDQDSTYVEGVADDAEDLYTLQDLVTVLGYTPQDVDGVQVRLAARRTDAFTRHVRLKSVVDATAEVQSAMSLTETYQMSQPIFYPQNPSTAAAWQVADIADIQVGFITGDGV